MSSYLVARITTAHNIAVRYHRKVIAVRGTGHLESLTLADTKTGVIEEVASGWLFIFIGASPRTDWLGSDIVRDERGFVVTGQDLIRPELRTVLAAGPATVHARDECAWRFRRRRCAAQFDEEGRLGCR